MIEQAKSSNRVLQENEDCHNLQQLTTKEIIKTILSSDKPICQIQQQLHQNKLKQYKLLKYNKTNLDLELTQKENEELKKYQQPDQIFDKTQYKNSYGNAFNEGRYQQYQSQVNQQERIFNDKHFKDMQMRKSFNKSNYKKNQMINEGGVSSSINYISQPSIHYKDEDNKQYIQTSSIEQENNFKECSFQQNLFQSSKYIQDFPDISQQYKPIKNNQINLDLSQNSINYNSNTSVQQHNAFLRKNSRMHIIRRSLVDMFNTNQRQPSPSPPDHDLNFKRLNSKFESLKHSLSQCEMSQMSTDNNKIFDPSFLTFRNYYNINNDNTHINNQNLHNHKKHRSSHQNPLSKSMVNSQKISLQDLVNKKKQEKCNRVFLGFTKILQNRKKSEQKGNNDASTEPILNIQAISQENIQFDNKKDLSLIKKIPLIKIRSNSQHSSRFQSKSSRLNNEICSQEVIQRKERLQSPIEDKKQIKPQNLQQNEENQSQQNLNESSLSLKEIQFPINFINKQQKKFQKIRSNSPEKHVKTIDFVKLANQKEEMDKKKQNKMIQSFLEHMKEQQQNIQINYNKSGISNLISQNNQPKIVSTFQYQPIQSINVTKYNEFKLSKKRRTFSMQNCKPNETQNQQDQNINKAANNKYYQTLLDQYDPQSIQVLKNKIISNENREDKGFDFNSFLYSKYINFVKNPIMSKNHNEIKTQQMKEIRKNYSLKNNELLQRSTSIRKSPSPSPQLIYRTPEQMERNMNFSGWDDTLDLNKRDDLEHYLKDNSKRDFIF